jgi:hypothetical protein
LLERQFAFERRDPFSKLSTSASIGGYLNA